MDLRPSFLFGRVMHARLFPAKNAFSYRIYYIAFRLQDRFSMKDGWRFGVNRSGLMSFYDRDHGYRDARTLEEWIHPLLERHNLSDAKDSIVLVCMPRIFQYVFNPVSFWLCHDAAGKLKAVVCEVNNTFGETHSYLCHMPERHTDSDEWVEAEKMFHVSPFLPREGGYKFRFQTAASNLSVQINYHDKNGEKQLITTLSGVLEPMSRRSWNRAFWTYPLVTFSAIFLIHWQAIRLWVKGQKYYTKPVQKDEKVTETLIH